MNTELFFLLVADGVLLLHALFVVFVILGQVLIIAGKLSGWSWVGNSWFRVLHLLAIATVVVQAWLGVICPLTTWEMMLRSRSGDDVYAGSFVAYWLEAILYYDLPPWVFVVCYTGFGTLVATSWFLVPPRRFGKHKPGN